MKVELAIEKLSGNVGSSNAVDRILKLHPRYTFAMCPLAHHDYYVLLPCGPLKVARLGWA